MRLVCHQNHHVDQCVLLVTVSVHHGNSVQYVWHVNKELELCKPVGILCVHQIHQPPSHFMFVLAGLSSPSLHKACS